MAQPVLVLLAVVVEGCQPGGGLVGGWSAGWEMVSSLCDRSGRGWPGVVLGWRVRSRGVAVGVYQAALYWGVGLGGGDGLERACCAVGGDQVGRGQVGQQRLVGGGALGGGPSGAGPGAVTAAVVARGPAAPSVGRVWWCGAGHRLVGRSRVGDRLPVSGP